jgi:hypothetical protein
MLHLQHFAASEGIFVMIWCWRFCILVLRCGWSPGRVGKLLYDQYLSNARCYLASPLPPKLLKYYIDLVATTDPSCCPVVMRSDAITFCDCITYYFVNCTWIIYVVFFRIILLSLLVVKDFLLYGIPFSLFMAVLPVLHNVIPIIFLDLGLKIILGGTVMHTSLQQVWP